MPGASTTFRFPRPSTRATTLKEKIDRITAGLRGKVEQATTPTGRKSFAVRAASQGGDKKGSDRAPRRG